MRLKKVLFVDEKQYRFSHYYENREWWLEKGIKPIFKDYEKSSAKYKIYLSLFYNRPDFIVMVHLNTKNIILLILASVLRIKTIFWQHGFFSYPININKNLKIFNLKITHLLVLSQYDQENISQIFDTIKNIKVIDYYDLANYNFKKHTFKRKDIHVAYIGQIISRKQVNESTKDKLLVSSVGNHDCFHEILQTIEQEKLFVSVVAKKHPGDKSNYLENLCYQYDFMNLGNVEDVLMCDIGIVHFSTMCLGFFRIGKPVLQIPMTNGKYMFNIKHYDQNNTLMQINTGEEFANFIYSFNTKCVLKSKDFLSISQQLIRIINK